jgi:DNA-binding NtrC family response regulator
MHKLLIVDDEAGIVDEVKDYFAEEGFEVHTADSGKDGIVLVQSLKPDVLILDMKLPDISGLEVLKVSKEQSPKTKVIVVTGYVDQGMIDKAEQLGRDAFLQKPFDLTFLIDEVNRLLAA